METVVDVAVPTHQFVLEETFERVPDLECEAVRVAVHSSERTMPFLWGSTSHLDRLDGALGSDPAAERVTCLSRADGRGLYAVDWAEGRERVIDDFVEASGSVLEVAGTADQWRFRVLFPDRSAASEAFQRWDGDDFDPAICRITTLSCREDGATGLSPMQHSVIAEAFRSDYYDVPRGTTLEELATNFEVSHQALSERLRRGHARLVERMLSD